MKLSIINHKGEDTGKKVDLKDTIYKIEPNEHAVYLDVKQFLANQRQGTHKSKERAEISGSTRKIKKQKGTGTARAGSIKSPLFRGGGRVFGPEPRDYSFKLNKKLKSLARKSALSSKAGAGAIFIVEDFSFDSPKTRELANILNGMKLSDQKTLIVTSDFERELFLSLQQVQVNELMMTLQRYSKLWTCMTKLWSYGKRDG